MRPPTPNERVVRALRSLPPVEAQNRLMRLSDREIALSMKYMNSRDRAALLTLLPEPKTRRILEEMTLHDRLAIRYEQYLAAVSHVIAGLEDRSRQAFRSYLRPRRQDRSR